MECQTLSLNLRRPAEKFLADSIQLRKVEKGDFRGSDREEAQEKSYEQTRLRRAVREPVPGGPAGGRSRSSHGLLAHIHNSFQSFQIVL